MSGVSLLKDGIREECICKKLEATLAEDKIRENHLDGSHVCNGDS